MVVCKYDKVVPLDGFSNVELREHTPEIWRPPENIARKVDDNWSRIINNNTYVFKGPLVRATNLETKGDTLYIDTQITDYKHHAATRGNPELADRANALYVAANILTSDGMLVFGKTEAGEFSGKKNIIAGAVHPYLDSVDGKPYPGLTLYREMEEEAGINFEDFMQGNRLKLKPGYVISEPDKNHPTIMYSGELNKDSEELVELHKLNVLEKCERENKKPEIKELSFVNCDTISLDEELNSCRNMYHPRIRLILDDLIEHPERLNI